MQRIILHIDFDSFFASVEQQNNPLLRAKPIGVTATNGRSCIIAASREAKKCGIHSPSRTYEAKKICPAIRFVPAHFVVYGEVSRKFLHICSDYSPFVEMFSIDEVFMDVTQTAQLFGGVSALIRTIKQRLFLEIGECITASFGISYNKLLAKLASGLDKPNGCLQIDQEDVPKIYQSIKLTDICGIGERITSRLSQLGIRVPLQLRFVPPSALIAEFGEVEGKFLHDVGLGIDSRPVVPYTQKPEVKSVSRNYCLPENEYDKRKVLQTIYELCEEVTLKLRRLKKKTRTVGIYLSGKQIIRGRRTVSSAIDLGRDLFSVCLSILRYEAQQKNMFSESQTMTHELGFHSQHNAYPYCTVPAYVRQTSVWTGNLIDSDTVTENLFYDSRRQRNLQQTVDILNDKFGDHTIRNGFLLYADTLTTVPNGYGADRLERVKLAENL